VRIFASNRDRTKCDRLAELLREQIRAEHTIPQALDDWDAFAATIPTALTSAHTYLTAALILRSVRAFRCHEYSIGS
jgi:hypothetical protein